MRLHGVRRRAHSILFYSPWVLCAQGASNTIKAQQVLFQAQKKATGNTFTARGMPLNLFATGYIVLLGAASLLNATRKMYNGIGKIE